MKKSLFRASVILAAFLFMSSLGLAQSRGQHDKPSRGPFKAIEELGQELQLTPEQAKAIDALQHRVREQYKEMHQSNRKNRAAMHANRMKHHQALKEDLKAILTPEQVALLEAHHETRKAERRAAYREVRQALEAYHEKNVKPVLLEQRQKLEMALSDGDKATIAEIRGEHAAMRKQRASEGESFRKHGHGSNPSSNRKALSVLVEKYNAEIEKLLKEIEPQRQQWEKDKKVMLNAHRGEGKYRNDKPHRGMPGMKKARFLLMDVSMVPKIENNIRN